MLIECLNYKNIIVFNFALYNMEILKTQKINKLKKIYKFKYNYFKKSKSQ